MSISSKLAQSIHDREDNNQDRDEVRKTLPAKGKMLAPVVVYSSPRLPLAGDELAALTRLAELPHVEKVVALPDLHLKPRLEAPSSIAVAVRDHLVLGLSSPSPNCGMALAKTGLSQEDIDERKQDALFARLAERLPLRPSVPALTAVEMEQVLIEGPRALLGRYGFDNTILENFDPGARPIEEPEVSEREVLEAVPPVLQEIGRQMFGQVGKGNHFLELQFVHQIFEPQTAKAWGLEQGQALFMYHADSGYLGAFIGRLFAHRQKNNWKGRVFEWRVKLPFHLKHGSRGRLFTRVGKYMLPRRFSFIPTDCEEGRRARLALWAAGNYANANRLAIMAVLRDSIREIWGDPDYSPVLLWDAPHNSIRPERIDGETLWVHRHNAARVRPGADLAPGSVYAGTGHPVLLPGTEKTFSYLCASGDDADQSLFSADHGAGRSALRLGRSQEAGSTKVYGYEGQPPGISVHVSDDGVQEVLKVLETAGIARRVAALKPAAVLKANA
jgi:tRNA-splicing ligase RtcB (3'-phosphate/5'-hydroxy nucleic acid ligase)